MLVTLSLLSTYMVAPPVPRTAVRCADCRMDLFGDVAKAAGDMATAAGDAATSLLDEPEEPKKRFAPKADETSALDQAARAAASGMTPAEYEEATRMAANKYLADNGAHIGGGGSGVQTADFLKQLWNVNSIPAISDESKSDSTRVLATVYEIGGPLTNILSTSVAKQLPLIPHVGIRVHG